MRAVQDMTEKEAKNYEASLWDVYYKSFPLITSQDIGSMRQLLKLLFYVQRRRKELRVRQGLA